MEKCEIIHSPMRVEQIAVCRLPTESQLVFRLKNRNDDDDNCVITNYYQHGPCNVEEYIMMELLMVTVISLTLLILPCI